MTTQELANYYKERGYSEILITKIITKWGPHNAKLQMLSRQKTCFNPWSGSSKNWDFPVRKTKQENKE